jgi:hypothetical protein
LMFALTPLPFYKVVSRPHPHRVQAAGRHADCT